MGPTATYRRFAIRRRSGFLPLGSLPLCLLGGLLLPGLHRIDALDQRLDDQHAPSIVLPCPIASDSPGPHGPHDKEAREDAARCSRARSSIGSKMR